MCKKIKLKLKHKNARSDGSVTDKFVRSGRSGNVVGKIRLFDEIKIMNDDTYVSSQ